VVTDRQGVYRITDVPTGNVVLSISYTGLNTQQVPVTISPGTPRQQDVGLTADIYTLNKFVVSGEREGNAAAMTLQRQSDGVRSIASTDAFGSLFGNPADLIMKLPGVEGESVGGDIRFIRVRGMSQNLLTVTLDGNRVGSATGGATTRDFEFSQSNADAIERIEVVKSPTPDMDGDSIGGAVNMVSKSAFDSSPERRISGSIGADWRVADSRDKMHPNYSLAYSEVFMGKLGVSLNWGYRVHTSMIDLPSMTHEAVPNGVAGPAYISSFGFTDFRSTRTRAGLGVKLDYKLSDSTRVSLNAQPGNHYWEKTYNTAATWSTTAAVATRDANSNLTGTGGIVPGYSDTRTDIRQITASNLNVGTTDLFQDGRLKNYSLGVVHKFEKLDIDYSAYRTRSKIYYIGTTNPRFIIPNVGFRIENTGDEFFRTVTQTAGPDWTNIANYTQNTFSVTPNTVWDGLDGAQINAKKSFASPVPTYLKTGLRWRSQARNRISNPRTGNWVGPDGVMGINPATGINDDNLAQFMERRLMSGNLARYNDLPFPRNARAGLPFEPGMEQSPQSFLQSTAANMQSGLQNATRFTEDIGAAYVMGHVDLGRVSVMGGLRVERTKTWGEGALQIVTPEERARRAAWVGPVTVAEDVRRRTAEFGNRQTRSGDYRTVLPGVHFKYSPVAGVVTRLSYATNIGRPSIGQLVPNTSVDIDNRTVASSNPSLKPQTANNFDFTAEYYFEPAGQITAGVFLKEIKNFIYTAGGATVPEGLDNGFEGNYGGYLYTTQYNGGAGRVRGFEVSYSQQFTFLPGFWSGLGAYANMTRMDAQGNYGAGNAITLATQSKIAGFNPLNANIGISYIRNRVSLRFQGNYRGRYLTSFNAIESRRTYRDARPTLDVKVLYTLSKHFDAYLDVSNITDTMDQENHVGEGVRRASSALLIKPMYIFGVRARL
jgi:TonB-dependent receptor